MELRLGHPLRPLVPSLANGPGWRIPVWVQGCSLRCTEVCLNPGFLGSSGGHVVTVENAMQSLFDAVHDALHDAGRTVEGLTVLGGEPSDQAVAVAALCREARERGLSTMVYTGLLREELEARPGGPGLLAATDLLVDGPFRADLYREDLAWRGSSNQRLLAVGERYRDVDLEAVARRQGKAFSLRVEAGGAMTLVGLQTRGGAARLEDLLEGTGYRV